ncbi:MAG: hypothetical protein RSC68_04390 [Acinetobacter sp.]
MSQIRCPYCSSVQVKAMSNQPKKYPRPTDPIALVDWLKGYDCKKCGNDFVVKPPKPKKPIGFFTKMLGWLLLGVIGFFIYMAIVNPNKNDTTAAKKPISEQTDKPEQKESILHDVFSEDAEKAAHEDIPTEADYKKAEKSIESSQDQNDTLSIKTTVRDSE